MTQQIEISDPHVAAAITYCRAVASGEIPAALPTIQACKRQLRDLERWAAGDESFPYRFDEQLAGRPCRFVESLPHVKGPRARRGELIELEPWQCFLVTTIYGWVRIDTGKRRFRRAYIEVARGNGKSLLLSALALYNLTSDGEEGAEVVSAATTRDQAKIVFGVAQAMLRKRPELRAKLGLKDTTHAIVQLRTSSTFFPLSREADNQDGLNVHLAVVDELHAHPTRKVYDVLETALAKRDQSLLIVITTAGTDTSGICYEIRTDCLKILQGAYEDDEMFAVIYTIDEERDDWTQPEVWRKANPNWGVSVMPTVVEGLARKAMRIASAQNNFKTKHLNVWCSSDVSWMSLQDWDRCGDPGLSINAFAKENCWIGFDLASRSDLACRARLFCRELMTPPTPLEPGEEGPLEAPRMRRHYYLFVASYLPSETVSTAPNASYEGWAREGWIKTTPGNVLDFDALKRDTLADQARFRIVGAPYDPWQASQLAAELLKVGIPMIEYRNTVMMMSEPMKELEALVRDGRLHHNADPCMRWQISNVVCHRDTKDNIKPNKSRQELKIDGPVAAIMALGRAMLNEVRESVYEKRGIRSVG